MVGTYSLLQIEKMQISSLEQKFLILLMSDYARGIPKPVRELRFHPSRKFRFDFAWGEPYKVAVEVEGGLYMPKSGHTNIKGFLANCDKNNLAVSQGWKVLRFTERHLNQTPIECLELVRKCLRG